MTTVLPELNVNSRKPERPHPTEFSPPQIKLLTFYSNVSSGTFMQHEWNKVGSG